MIGIPEIARRLGVDMATVRRLIARESEALQLTLHRGRADRLLLSKDDADRLIASYEARRGPFADAAEDSAKFDRYGVFYVIQLVPEALPNRVKVGFADSVEKRLINRAQDCRANREAAQSMALQEVVGLRRNGQHHARGLQAGAE
jgi:hypothetical protein